ncbi:CPBP family intramembrane glutamic endopeptidase [Paenibacillus pini]|uniref:CAAX prenyl protease 2/Lysostaphin resistance protein A-like domain-containing protein n=1 Tax=Paenibacillus pini JCM 16418 TaxID=1236976 RepID=W7YQ48_9BACL|nr:CPBP family intramembrane glutamic endopeptidase [Paenibacillus pini]GAF09613.1 hypothetical protein JCM16418_3763 [Paenibacillus pini JCM 16418]
MSIEITNNKNTSPYAKKHPIWTVVIVELLLLIIMFAAGAYATIKKVDDATLPVLIAFIPIAIALIIYLSWKRRWRYMGFRPLLEIPKRGWLYYLPFVAVLAAISASGFKEVTSSELLYFLGFTLLVGFVEETVYRGLILKALLNKSIPTAVITSSVLFGITHLLNMLSGQNLLDTIMQIIYALLIGAALSLLIIKNNNILPLILFHFIHNLIRFLSPEVAGTSINTPVIMDGLVILILLAQCIWIASSLKKKTKAIT